MQPEPGNIGIYRFFPGKYPPEIPINTDKNRCFPIKFQFSGNTPGRSLARHRFSDESRPVIATKMQQNVRHRTNLPPVLHKSTHFTDLKNRRKQRFSLPVSTKKPRNVYFCASLCAFSGPNDKSLVLTGPDFAKTPQNTTKAYIFAQGRTFDVKNGEFLPFSVIRGVGKTPHSLQKTKHRQPKPLHFWKDVGVSRRVKNDVIIKAHHLKTGTIPALVATRQSHFGPCQMIGNVSAATLRQFLTIFKMAISTSRRQREIDI